MAMSHEDLADLTARLVQERLDEIDGVVVPRALFAAVRDLIATAPRSAAETEAAEKLRSAVARTVKDD